MPTFLAIVFTALAVVAALSTGRSPEELVHELGSGDFSWQGDEILRVRTNVRWAIFENYIFVVDADFPWGA